MRFRRSRRTSLMLLSTSPVPPSRVHQIARIDRRRRFRLIRTGALLTVIGVMRLARIARAHWRLSLGLCGVLLEVLGHVAFAGGRGSADLLGLVLVLFAWLKSEDPASGPAALPQTAWRWHG